MPRICFCSILSLAVALVLGCGEKEEKTTTEPVETTAMEVVQEAEPEAKADPAPAATIEIGPEVQVKVVAQLAAADKVDGQVDKIVHRCASCALGMDGKSEYALEVSGYTLHFCSGHCKEGFAENAPQSILDLKIPEN